VVNLVGVEPAEILGQALAGLAARQRKQGIRPGGAVSVAVTPSCGRLSVTVSEGRTSSTLSSPTARCTVPSIRLASQPARMSSAGSVFRPDTSAEVTSS